MHGRSTRLLCSAANVDALLPSVNRSKQFMVIRNCLVFDLIGTTALFTAAIGDADAAQKWSHAYLLQVMTPGDTGMAKAEVQTALVQATIALRKPDELEHMKVQGCTWHTIGPSQIKEGTGRNFDLKKRPKGLSPMLPRRRIVLIL